MFLFPKRADINLLPSVLAGLLAGAVGEILFTDTHIEPPPPTHPPTHTHKHTQRQTDKLKVKIYPLQEIMEKLKKIPTPPIH